MKITLDISVRTALQLIALTADAARRFNSDVDYNSSDAGLSGFHDQIVDAFEKQEDASYVTTDLERRYNDLKVQHERLFNSLQGNIAHGPPYALNDDEKALAKVDKIKAIKAVRDRHLFTRRDDGSIGPMSVSTAHAMVRDYLDSFKSTSGFPMSGPL
jgi:hypothetical protein